MVGERVERHARVVGALLGREAQQPALAAGVHRRARRLPRVVDVAHRARAEDRRDGDDPGDDHGAGRPQAAPGDPRAADAVVEQRQRDAEHQAGHDADQQPRRRLVERRPGRLVVVGRVAEGDQRARRGREQQRHDRDAREQPAAVGRGGDEDRQREERPEDRAAALGHQRELGQEDGDRERQGAHVAGRRAQRGDGERREQRKGRQRRGGVRVADRVVQSPVVGEEDEDVARAQPGEQPPRAERGHAERPRAGDDRQRARRPRHQRGGAGRREIEDQLVGLLPRVRARTRPRHREEGPRDQRGEDQQRAPCRRRRRERRPVRQAQDTENEDNSERGRVPVPWEVAAGGGNDA